MIKMVFTNICVRIINKDIRSFSTSQACYSLKNFRKFPLYGFRGGRRFRERLQKNPDPAIPIYKYGIREPGYTHKGKFHLVPEMIPELIVPDLTDCKLKPYVSYKVDDVCQSEFTSKNLFDAIYSEKITTDFKKGKLDEDGNPLEPSEAEKLTAEEAVLKSRKTGSDLFDQIIKINEEENLF